MTIDERINLYFLNLSVLWPALTNISPFHLILDTSSEQRSDYVTMTRYLTYLGLCIATCVIFQSSTWMAALVGIAVAVYISVSEFWLSATTSANGGVGGPFGPTVPDQLAAQVREKLGF